jgi:hypothetical protein
MAETEHDKKADPTALTTDALHREIERLEKLIDVKLALHLQMFKGIDQRFIDNKTAVDAAFQSAKEAISKSEGSTEKRIEGFMQNNGDLKERVTRIEGSGGGMEKMYGWGVGLILLAIAVASFYVNNKK